MPFRITTKNVLQCTVDSAKEKLKGKFLKNIEHDLFTRGHMAAYMNSDRDKWKIMFFSFDYVIKEMVNVAAVQPWSYGCTWEICLTLKKLESHSAIASCDSYSSFVLSNLPRESISPWLHAARLPFFKLFSSPNIITIPNLVLLPLSAQFFHHMA